MMVGEERVKEVRDTLFITMFTIRLYSGHCKDSMGVWESERL